MNRQDAATYALESLKKAGAQMASCRATTGFVEELNAAAGEFSLMRTLFNSSMTLLAIKDMKKGTAMINKLDKEEIDNAVTSCMAAVEVSKPDEAEGISEKIENKSFSSGVFTPDRDKLYDRIEEFMAEIKTKYPKILLEEFFAKYNFSETTFINSNGVELNSKNGYYNFSSMFSAKDGKKTSSINGYGARFIDLNTKFMDIGLTRSLFEETERQIETKPVDGKFTGKIILTPSGLESFLQMALGNFITDKSLIDGTSIWKDKLNALVAHPSLTVRIAPHSPEIVCGTMITPDGYAAEDMDVIKDGVLKSFMLSRYAAKKTGNQIAKNLSWNLMVAPGKDDYAKMIASIDRGLIVNRFSGGHPSSNGDFSGVAKNSFMIENGKITDAVSETMINGNLADIFNNITAISKEAARDGGAVLPWITVDGVTVSGKQ